MLPYQWAGPKERLKWKMGSSYGKRGDNVLFQFIVQWLLPEGILQRGAPSPPPPGILTAAKCLAGFWK